MAEGEWRPDVLVVGPGGAKGFCFLGALVALSEGGLLEETKTFCGVSVGALVALLLVAGYPVRQIISLALDTDIFGNFEVGSFRDILRRVLDNTGLISPSSLRERLNELLLARFGVLPTFRQLYFATGLVLVTVDYDLDDDRPVYRSVETQPQMSVVDAVLMSLNIPFLFYRLVYEGHTIVDGALGNSYPVDYFDDGESRILGLYVRVRGGDYSSLSNYTSKLLQCGMDANRLALLRCSGSNCRHLELTTAVIDTTGLTVSLADKARMTVEGYLRARDFLQNPLPPSLPLRQRRKDAPFYSLTHP